MATTSYVIALGSNRPTPFGSPAATLRAAIARLDGVVAISPLVETAPIGPSRRRFVNAVVVVESALAPDAMLERLKRMEGAFGRRRGQRWGARPIDLDLILWSGGCWASPGLVIPHPQFRARAFVLGPLAAIAPGWRDPVSARTVRQLARRHARPRKVDPGRPRD